MAIIGSLLGALGRFAGKLVNSALGWASVLLFGRVPQSKQILLSAVTLGSIAWVVVLFGVVLPDLGTILVAAVPAPRFVDRNWIRLAMLVAAVVLPLAIGFATSFLVVKDRRPKASEMLKTSLRGYPFAAVLAVVLIFLAVVALVRKVQAVARRREDAHIPIVLKPGGYDRLVGDLADVLDAAGLGSRAEPAPKALVVPAKLLGAVAGSNVKSLVPDRLMDLKAPDLDVLVYPSDISLQGTKQAVARGRAAIATRLTQAPAYLTTSEEAQKVEDRIELAARQVQEAQRAGSNERAAASVDRTLGEIDRQLAGLTVEYDEWETLYRMRLQVERSLLTGEAPGQPTGAMKAGGSRTGQAGSTPGAGAMHRRGPASGLELAASALGLALVALDVTLSVADRVAPPPLRRRRTPLG